MPGPYRLSDYMADRRHSVIPDALERNVFFQSGAESEHTVLTVGNTITQTTDELMRIKSVQVGTVSGGTVMVQVQVEGRDIFDDTVRPVSAGAVREPTDVYTFPAGTPVSTIIEATSGVPAGTASVVIETEPYELRSPFEEVTLRRGNRLRISKRRDADLANAGATFIERSLITRTKRRAVSAQRTATGQQQVEDAYAHLRDPSTGKVVVPRGQGPQGGPRPRRRA